MRLFYSTSRKSATPRWTCPSCRAIRRIHVSREPISKFDSLSRASEALRSLGPARARFAPSPTGYLHLGSLRTALFNYLVAKATGGQFVLRIEDTDQKRTVPGAEAKLLEDLEWAGIEWDEGPRIGGPFGPYKQSERTALYRAHAEQLLHSGHAYRCFCSPERLQTMAKFRHQIGLPPDYDRKCSHVSRGESHDRAAKGEAHVVRLRAPDKYPVFNDLVYGPVRQRSDFSSKIPGSAQGSYDDPILMKSDGFPTYHLANVVDDHLMEITHVIRGSEWMSSTPKHIAMYNAFGWQPPAFAHVGLLLDKDKQKLSKRTGAADLTSWREKGIFPETMMNFVALLGWSHNAGNDVMDMKDLIRNASMKYTKGDTVVTFEKLWFLQKRHAGRYAALPPSTPPLKSTHDLTELAVKPLLELLDHRAGFEDLSFYENIPQGSKREEHVRSILLSDAQNYTTPIEFANRNIYFFVTPSREKVELTVPSMKLRNVPSQVSHDISLAKFIPMIDSISELESGEWAVPEIKSWINWMIDQATTVSLMDVKERNQTMDDAVRKAWTKTVYQYLRWAIMAGKPGPDLSETMRILGSTETINRMKLARNILASQVEGYDMGEH